MITFVLVHYNANDIINNCISSILTFSGLELESMHFVIVDNSSNLDIRNPVYEGISYHYYNPKYNSGFARAVNYGILNAKGDYVVLINQDAWLFQPNTIKGLLDLYAVLPNKTILSCRIEDNNGNFQQSIWLDSPDLTKEFKNSYFFNKINPNWKIKFNNKIKQIHKNTGFVNRLNGAFLIMPLNTNVSLEDVLFDNDYFLYNEDVEWANRLKRNGWHFYFKHEISIKHYGSYSSVSQYNKSKQILVSSWLTVRKSKGLLYFIAYFCLSYFNLLLDYLLDKIKGVNNLGVAESFKSFNTLAKNHIVDICFLRRKENGFIAKSY